MLKGGWWGTETAEAAEAAKCCGWRCRLDGGWWMVDGELKLLPTFFLATLVQHLVYQRARPISLGKFGELFRAEAQRRGGRRREDESLLRIAQVVATLF